jgi:hypothetical protein
MSALKPTDQSKGVIMIATQDRIPQILLRGSIKCETPVSFVLPHVGRAAKNREAGGQPTIITPTGERLYINAPAIRSAVRHAAVELLHDLTGKAYRMDDYFLNAIGGIKDAGKESGEAAEAEEEGEDAAGENAEAQAAAEARAQHAHTLKFAFVREKNPIVALFGTLDVPGSVECSHAIDSSPEPVRAQEFRGVRANDLRRNPNVTGMLAPGALDDFIARQTEAAKRSAIKRDIAALEKNIRKLEKSGKTDEVKALRERKAALESQMRDSKVVQVSLPNLSYEAIPPGTVLTHEWALRRVSELELALFVQSLALWALDPKLGGHRGHGLGRVSAQWDVSVRRPLSTRLESFGSLSIRDYDGLQAEGEIARYLDPQILRAAADKLDLSHESLASLK